MLQMNFVPEDYVRNSQSRRTNFIYMILFLLLVGLLGGYFLTINLSLKAYTARENALNEEMGNIHQKIQQFEQLQTKRTAMMKAALTTAELVEPVPRSILLASMTNNLPSGVSLIKVKVAQQKARFVPVAVKANSKFEANKKQAKEPEPVRQKIETHIELRGLAPSDLQVAAFLKQLSSSEMLDQVALVESKEKEIDEIAFREFSLKAMLRDDIQITNDSIEALGVNGQVIQTQANLKR